MGLLVVALLTISLAALISSVAGSSAERTRPCTHGASSIGPVFLDHGHVVGGSTTPHTEACLP